MIGADIDEALVALEVIDSIGVCERYRGVGKIMAIHFGSVAFAMPLPPVVLVVADKFLFLGVHGNHRRSPVDAAFRQTIDVLELGVAIGIALAFLGFAVALKAIAKLMKLIAHRLMYDLRPLTYKLGRKLARTLAGPTQGRFRISTRQRFDQAFELGPEGRVVVGNRLSTAARFADPLKRQQTPRFHLGQTAMDGRTRKTGSPGNKR